MHLQQVCRSHQNEASGWCSEELGQRYEKGQKAEKLKKQTDRNLLQFTKGKYKLLYFGKE